ncbi:MAG: hypothetical protein FJ290_04425 [Planctomycetes bacterium]|nr:hypothetical protein [Planctomycetota bacterium]
MELSLKANLSEALARWQAFWHKEIIRRPAAVVTAPKEGVKPVPGPRYPTRPDDDLDAVLDQVEAHLATVYFAGEAMPRYEPCFGPDQLAAFVGARLDYSPDSSGTSWSVPFVESWEEALPLRLEGHAWERFLEFHRKAGERARGKWVVCTPDLHSNFDWLVAIREPAKLCMDLLDTPEFVHRAMGNVRALYRDVYNAVYAAAGMYALGTSCWLPYYCQGRFCTVQCDFSCLLSPPQFNEFVLPALTEECEFLDRSVYHYDGRTCLQHFDAITGIKALDGIQWTPTAGGPPMLEWLDLLKRFQATGKHVYVGCTPDELKSVYHRELKPDLVLYNVGCKSEREADELLLWLERNT